MDKALISPPLEAGPSLLDAQRLPSHLDAALAYTARRLARKSLSIDLVVLRRAYQLPGGGHSGMGGRDGHSDDSSNYHGIPRLPDDGPLPMSPRIMMASSVAGTPMAPFFSPIGAPTASPLSYPYPPSTPTLPDKAVPAPAWQRSVPSQARLPPLAVSPPPPRSRFATAIKSLVRSGALPSLTLPSEPLTPSALVLTLPSEPLTPSALVLSPASEASTPSRLHQRMLRNGAARGLHINGPLSSSSSSPPSAPASASASPAWPFSPASSASSGSASYFSVGSMPSTPATPAAPATPALSESSTATVSSVSTARFDQHSRNGTGGDRAFGIRLVHADSLPWKHERVLRHTLDKAARKFRLGRPWLGPSVAASALELPAAFMDRSEQQNEVAFAAPGLRVRWADSLYTFKAALASYASEIGSHSSNNNSNHSLRLEDAVDELRRYVLTRGQRDSGGSIERRLPKRELVRHYPELRFTESDLADVMHMYSRAYGGPEGDCGVEMDGLSSCPPAMMLPRPQPWEARAGLSLDEESNEYDGQTTPTSSSFASFSSSLSSISSQSSLASQPSWSPSSGAILGTTQAKRRGTKWHMASDASRAGAGEAEPRNSLDVVLNPDTAMLLKPPLAASPAAPTRLPPLPPVPSLSPQPAKTEDDIAPTATRVTSLLRVASPVPVAVPAAASAATPTASPVTPPVTIGADLHCSQTPILPSKTVSPTLSLKGPILRLQTDFGTRPRSKSAAAPAAKPAAAPTNIPTLLIDADGSSHTPTTPAGGQRSSLKHCWPPVAQPLASSPDGGEEEALTARPVSSMRRFGFLWSTAAAAAAAGSMAGTAITANTAHIDGVMDSPGGSRLSTPKSAILKPLWPLWPPATTLPVSPLSPFSPISPISPAAAGSDLSPTTRSEWGILMDSQLGRQVMVTTCSCT